MAGLRAHVGCAVEALESTLRFNPNRDESILLPSRYSIDAGPDIAGVKCGRDRSQAREGMYVGEA